MKCIGKHPKAPTFNIDFDTNQKVEKMKKMKKFWGLGFFGKDMYNFSKNFNNAFQKNTKVSTQKIPVSLSVPLSKRSPQWFVQCFKFLHL